MFRTEGLNSGRPQPPYKLSWVELPQMLDVPGVVLGDAVQRLQPDRSRPGDAGDAERTLPHGRELVLAQAQKNEPQDKVSDHERARADLVLMVLPQALLVPGVTEDSAAASLFDVQEVILSWFFLVRF